MWKKILVLGLVVVLLVAGYMWKNQSKEKVLEDTANPLQVVKEAHGIQPVFLEFSSDSCPYCVKMAPIVAELQEKYKDKVSFVIANTENNKEARELAYYFKVQGVPTFFIIDKEAKEAQQFVGLVKKEDLEKAIKSVLLTETQ